MAETCAITLQHAWRRSRECRKGLVEVYNQAKGVYRKQRDQSSGEWYYYNTHTGESSWVKPWTLGKEDVAASAEWQKLQDADGGRDAHRTTAPGSCSHWVHPR